ncbi:MAG TPA: 3-deoxy-D-manno-octulosonic acid transferase [Gammaproteobacteria bacterium]|nr:3-deoxy-D-manno-octulosonic acid transferase [Gammaproteobacteria bacterium]
MDAGYTGRVRALYSFLLYLMLPWVLLRLWLKGRRVPGYRQHWKERFGYVDVDVRQPVVWLHAVSVGEVRAAAPLVRALLEQYPERQVLVTTSTPTGRETAQGLFGDDIDCRYLPYDLPAFVHRFLDAVQPVLALVLETEIWPVLYALLEKKRIPLLLLNARLSEKSLRGYLRLRPLMQPALRAIRHIAARNEQDAQRFRRLGVRAAQLSVMGDLKFELQLPADFGRQVEALRKRLGPDRAVWVAGSTHRGEETQLLAAHRRVLADWPGALLVIAPRHPERAAEVAALCAGSGLASRFSSAMSTSGDGFQVLIIDRLGVLLSFYGVAQAVFVGGSLVAAGGHNPVEPLCAGAPVMTGPHTDHFSALYQDLLRSHAACRIRTGLELAEQVCDWFGDTAQRQAAVDAGRVVIERNRGALQHALRLLEGYLRRVEDVDPAQAGGIAQGVENG